ncbi:MAG: cytochrome ubiquinol oxidase subunit I [Waddliaceae bacterium]|nr:cytochrome ubiquinol oxidase subunit I [Waddliaceae bacterium]
MEDLLAARMQMGISLAFHIIFACVGIAMPFLMATAHALWLRTRNPVYFTLTKAWSKGVAIFFATGAVSGTALSFELGLFWPKFMEHAGGIIGMPFSWEGAAFFLEAIALGIFLYGWNKIPDLMHWFSGLMVGITGVASAIFVVAANAWMNNPAGFDWVNGQAINIDPWAAMFNGSMLVMGIHMVIGAFQATAFSVAGLHALLLLRDRTHPVHQAAMKIALVFGVIFSLIQPLSGDFLAKNVARTQPIKLAAMEGLFQTEKGAPLLIGGLPNESKGVTEYAIHLPKMLSFLAFGDFDAEVQGLSDFPRDEWPPVAVTHIAFQIMVGCGTVLMLVGFVYLFILAFRREVLFGSCFLCTVGACTPLGILAIWAGWTVTEVGRQPWIIYKIMRTHEALTPMPGLVYPLILFMGVYALLIAAVAYLMWRQIRSLEEKKEWEESHG